MQSTRGQLSTAFRTGFFFLICLLGLTLAAGRSSARGASDPLVIAASEDSAPLSYLDANGRPAGLLIDLWSLWSQKTGQSIKFLPSPFGQSLEDVRNGRAQMHAGCFKSPERSVYLDFVEPLYPIRTDIYFQNNLRLRDRNDLLAFRVGAVRGDYASDYLRQEIPGIAFRFFDRYEELFSSLNRNELKVFVSDQPVAQYYLERLGLLNKYHYNTNASLYTRRIYAAVQKDNSGLARMVRDGLKRISKDELAALEHKWIGVGGQKTENLLHIACPNEYEPFAMRTITGEAAGMLVDLWRSWAQKVGVKVAFTFSDWTDSIHNVLNGESDFHCGMLPVDGNETLAFGPPTYPTDINLFALPKTEAVTLPSLVGKKLAVLGNSQQEAWLSKNAPRIQLLRFDDTQAMVASVFQNQAAALCNSLVNTHAVLDMNGLTDQLRASHSPLFYDYLRPAVRPDRKDLLELLQSGFDKITNREFNTIEERWISNPRQQLFSFYGRNVRFSQQELQRIADLPALRLGIRSDRPPLEFVSKNGEYEGIIPEILQLLAQRFFVYFQPQTALDWNATLKQARAGDIDVVSELPATSKNAGDFVFTETFFEYPLVVVTRSEYPFFADLTALEGKTMAVARESGLISKLKKKYPGIRFVAMDSYDAALKDVSGNKVDCCLGGMLTLPYLANKLKLENIKIALHTDLVKKLHMAVPRKHKEFVPLLDKMLSAIPKRQIEKITESWVMARFEPTTDWDFVWKVALSIAAAAGIILGVILIWNRRLAREINYRRAIEQRLSSMAANVPGAIFQSYVRPDGEYGYYYFSKRSEELFGFTEEEAKADPDILQIVPEDRERCKASYDLAVQEITNWNFTGRIITPDGSIKWINATAKPIRENNGEIVFNGILLDITERKLVAQKYLETEKKIRAMSEAIHDALLMVDSHGTVQFWNPAAELLFGIPAEEALGVELQVLLPPVQNRDYLCNRVLTFLVNEKLRTEGSAVQETVARNRNGYEIPVDLALNPFEVEGLRYVVATVRDISSRKEADARIQDQLMFSNALIDTIPNPIFIMDTHARYLGCNRAYESTFDVSRDAIIGKQTEELEHFPRQFRTMLRGEELAALSEREMRHHELRLTFPNGQEHRLLYWCTTFNLSDGRLAGLINVMVDITAQKRTEQDLHILSQAVECSPISVLLLDRDGKIQYANPTFYQRLMLEQSDVAGKSYAAFLSSRNPADVLESLRETMITGGNWQGDLISTTRYGEMIWESAWYSPITDAEGEVTHYAAMKEDITGRKKMEYELIEAKDAAEAATKAKSEFLARMSHEIRTPMNAIMGMTHLALQTSLDDKQLDYLKKIQSSATALLNIINDILDFSKIEAGKMQLESIEFRLEDVLDSLGGLVSFSAGEKGLELLFNLDPDVPQVLLGDPLRLNQVLINLANNAVKFTEQGEIVISTKLQQKDNDRVTITFSVKDTGIGLSTEQQTHLFQSFSQADGSTTRKFGGTGLGLAICKRLVDLMDGDIWVESQVNQGSQFFFTAAFGYRERFDDRLLLPPVKMRQLPTLVVDDNSMARNILRHTLESFTFQVDTAKSGSEALDLLRQEPKDNPYKLIIMDMTLPGMSGVEVTEKIKNRLQLPYAPKVILLTSYSGEEASQGNVSVPFDGILVKPVSRSLLFNTIMYAFGNSRGQMVTPSEFSQGNLLQLARERLAGAHALLVEDNDINQEIAVELIEQAGLRVDVASNGLEAVRAAMDTDYDIILMDIQMPEMDGLEATEKIRRLEKPWGRDVAILAMTAHALVGDREKSLESGMNAHIVKPIDPDELYEALLHWTRPPAVSAAPDAPQPMEAAAAVPVENDLPGLSVRSGLQRVSNNRELYGNLLRRFRSGNTDFLFRLRHALAGDDTSTAVQMLHTLKGVAGNLGAEELFDAAAELENLLKAEQAAGLDEALATLQTWFGRVLEAIAVLEPEDKEDAETVAGAEPVDAQAVLAILDTFEKLLGEDVSEALDCLGALHPFVQGTSLEPGCKTLRERLEAFDSDGALAMSRLLREQVLAEPPVAEAAVAEKDQASEVSESAPLPAEQLDQLALLLQKMVDSLDADLVESLTYLEQLPLMLESGNYAAELKMLAEQLEHFDTDAARNTLQAIARQCGIALHGE